MAGCSDASQQGLDSVSCFESTNFDQAKSDNETVVSTPEMDAAAIENGESLLSENSERVGQIKDGTPASASEVVGQPVEKNGVITTTAKIPDSADAVIHSHAEKGGEIAPGPKDNSVVEGGRPNYIYHKGRLAVVEKSGGQYRLRIIQSYPTKREATRIEARLNKYQKN